MVPLSLKRDGTVWTGNRTPDHVRHIVMSLFISAVLFSGCSHLPFSPIGWTSDHIIQVVSWQGFDDCSDWRGGYEVIDHLSVMMEKALEKSGRFSTGIFGREPDALCIALRSGMDGDGYSMPFSRYFLRGTVSRLREIVRESPGIMGLMGVFNGEAEAVVTVEIRDCITGELVGKVRGYGRIPCRVGNLSDDRRTTQSFSKFTRTSLGKASAKCMEDAVSQMAVLMADFPLDAWVTNVLPEGKVMINRGREAGVMEGDRFVFVSSGESVSCEMTVVVSDSGVSYCRVEEGSVYPGMMVRMRGRTSVVPR